MQTSVAYCPGCNHPVRLTLTDEHPRDSQANLPEGGDLVCLDFQSGCSEGTCPLTGKAGIVMGVRLARSHLPHEARLVHTTCSACGQLSELEVLDANYAVCTLCESTLRIVTLSLNDETRIIVTE